MNPLFSVIIPVYNVVQYLDECLQSVLQQSFSDYEIILIDDCSNDGSYDLCVSYAANDTRISVFRHDTNRGLSEARNSGMRMAKGRYLTFLDSDDYWQGEILSKVSEVLTADSDIEVVRGRYIQLSAATGKYGRESYCFADKPYSGMTFLGEMMKNGILEPSVWLYFFLADLAVGENLNFVRGIVAEDYEWTPRLLQQAEKLVCISDVFYVYRMKRAGSIVNTRGSAKRFVDAFMFVLSNVGTAIVTEPVLHEYYLNAIPLMLNAIGQMDRTTRKKKYRQITRYHYLLEADFPKARVLRLFIAFFGERRYGYPFYLINFARLRVNEFVFWLKSATSQR